MTGTVLVAGLGNVFFGDDAFGVEVVHRLATRPLPEGVRVVDFGIRARDLAYALMDGHGAAILVDAVRRGRAPGTLYVLEPEVPEGTPAGSTVDHASHPAQVVMLARQLGGRLPVLRLVGCEPASLGDDEEGAMGLSPAVEGALERAADSVLDLCRTLIIELAGSADA